MSRAKKLAKHVERTVTGPMWHGPALAHVLEGVTHDQAAARPIKNAHTIWELVLHIAAWDNAVLQRLGGVAVELSDAENFPAVTDASETAWRKALADVRRVHEQLVEAVSVLPDSRLDEKVPGKTEYPEQSCPFCNFRWTGPKARKSNQCPRCHKTIWHEPQHESMSSGRTSPGFEE